MKKHSNILGNIKRYVSLTEADEREFTSIIRTTAIKKRQFIVQPNFTCTHQTPAFLFVEALEDSIV